MTHAEESSAAADRVGKVLQQIGLELAFAAPGQAASATTLDDLFTSLLVALPDSAPAALVAGVTAAAERLLTVAGGVVRPSAEALAYLAAWHPWCEEALAAWGAGRPVTTWQPTTASGETAAAPPATAAPAPPAAVTVAPPAPAATAPSTPAAPLPDLPELSVDVLPADADPDLLHLFCAEAQDLLRDIEQGVLALETDPGDSGQINALFRAFHTFKGNAGVMKLAVLQQFTHELESLLDHARRGSLALGREAIGVILAGADVLERFVAELAAQVAGTRPPEALSLPIPAVIEATRRVMESPAAAGPVAEAPARVPPPVAPPVAPAPPAPAVASAVAIGPAPTGPSAVGASPPVVPVAASVAPTPVAHQALPVTAAPPPAAAAPATPRGAPARVASGAIVRVDTHKLDSLIDLVGELVIAQSMVVQHPDLVASGDTHLSRAVGQLRGITSDLRRTAMALRMVPIRGTFQKMARLVRDLALQQGKEIQLVLEGEETELDRTVVDDLSDPLVHMIRNSADHGIEPPAEREAAGKPRQGTITLQACHQGGYIVIRIRDDGRGLSPERIRRKAEERGIVAAGATLDRREVLELIFAPGFSTAETVTDLSGRGVGMDVVRRTISGLRGKIEIDSTVGSGTTFTLSVPLTLAIIEGLLVGVAGERYVIPTLSVRESFRLQPEMVSRLQGRGEMVMVHGRLVPLLRLRQRLGLDGAAPDGVVVVVEAGALSRCLLVDDLIGKQEVVIKDLGEIFRDRTDFAGAAILGDGRVGLILDVAALVQLRGRQGEAAA
ncbi:MAG: chemotaxis protein CheA [Planctomycetia bacterium]|nr:chemotaxis protein CheA [Planctomycetia bacterium]